MKTQIEKRRKASLDWYRRNKKKVHESGRKWRKENPEKCLEYALKWRKENPEKVKKAARKRHKKNPEKKNKANRKWRKENPEKVKKAARKHYKNNSDKYLEQSRKWRKNNSKIINERQKKRYKTDPKYKLAHNISITIGASLQGNKNSRHWEDIIGYSLNDLKKHLEKQFTKNMSWGNYGKGGWTLDHKIPLSVFNFTKPEHQDFKKAWALSNLQPMWAKDNFKKSNKLTKPFQPSLLF